VTLAIWGLIVAFALVLGSLPALLGLAVVMPVLAHATWHLYRRVVEPGLGPRPELRPRSRAPRYAADFPAALFPTQPIEAEPSGEAPAPEKPREQTRPPEGTTHSPPLPQ
jgi:hypothetical protein